MNGHTSECSLSMYRGPHVCICGADRRSRPMSESKHNPVPQENTVIFDPPADSAEALLREALEKIDAKVTEAARNNWGGWHGLRLEIGDLARAALAAPQTRQPAKPIVPMGVPEYLAHGGIPFPERAAAEGSDDAMPTHDNGCRCWPHVSRSDAEQAIERVALAEYRSAIEAEARAGDGLRAALDATDDPPEDGPTQAVGAWYRVGWQERGTAIRDALAASAEPAGERLHCDAVSGHHLDPHCPGCLKGVLVSTEAGDE